MDQTNSNTIIKIANPNYWNTFKDLFGANGSEFGRFRGKERLLSFLQELFPNDNIQYVEYINRLSEVPGIETTTFDVTFNPCDGDILCKCFDENATFIFDVGVQKRSDAHHCKRAVSHAGNLLIFHIEDDTSSIQRPKVRIVSLNLKNLDKSKPSIFDAKITEPTTKEVLTSIIWTYIQLPKLRNEGTNNKWLQILSVGAINKRFVEIDSSKFSGNQYKSALSLLESYRDPEKQKILKAEDFAYFKWKSILYDFYCQGKEKGAFESQLNINRNMINSIVNCMKNGRKPKEISKRLKISDDVVNFVISIIQFWDYFSQLENSEINDEIFEEEIRKFFNFPE